MHCYDEKFVAWLRLQPKYTEKVVVCNDGHKVSVWFDRLGLKTRPASDDMPADYDVDSGIMPVEPEIEGQ